MLFRSTKFKLVSLILVLAILFYAGPRQILLNYFESRGLPGSNRLGQSTDAQDNLRFDDLLVELHQLVKKSLLEVEANPKSSFTDIDQVTKIKQSLEAENKEVLVYFDQQETFIADQELPTEILARHSDAVKAYQADYATLMEFLEEIETAQRTGSRPTDWQNLLAETDAFLVDKTPEPQESNFDPENLPHRSLRAEQPIPPKLTIAEWQAAYPKRVTAEEKRRLARLSESLLEDQPGPEDLAETIEVQFTEDISQLAADLNNNPVEIYNWVHNNIEFVPIWGSIQGAQLCLETRVCNAFDTSSLFIALLRVSGIPARYQMGTIEVPVDEAMNWFGGFSDPAAAARYAASGGVPSAGTVEQGGSIRSIRMEHIWVAAFVDYVPSKGQVNIEGDSWIDLDPSYKLHEFIPGTDLAAALGFDQSSYFDHIDMTTQVNSEEGAIVYFDTDYISQIDNQLTEAVATIYPNQDLEDEFPRTQIVQKNLPILPAALTYEVLVYGNQASVISSGDRHGLSISVLGSDGAELVVYSATLPELALESISLNYEPASDADLETIRSFVLPNVPTNAPTDLVERIMAEIPANLVKVRPVIELNGIDVAIGEPDGMGKTHTLVVSFTAPTVETAPAVVETVAWGRYGMTLDLGSISNQFLQRWVDDYEQLVNQQEPDEDIAPVSSAARDLAVLTWFNQVDRYANGIGRLSGVAFARYPSLGFSYAAISSSSLFGTPVEVSMDGLVMDIARQLQVIATLNGTAGVETAFSFAVGAMSSTLEGTMLVRFVHGDDNNLTGISTSSAIWAAAEQDIPVQLIDSTNLESGLAVIDDGYSKESISNAVHAGRVVLVPRQPPVIDEQQVFAYLALDPDTGDGAYIVGETRGTWLRALCPDDALDFQDCSGWLVTTVDILWFIGLAALAIVAFVVLVELVAYAIVGILIIYEFFPLIAAALIPILNHPAFVPVTTGFINFGTCIGGGGGPACLRHLISAFQGFYS